MAACRACQHPAGPAGGRGRGRQAAAVHRRREQRRRHSRLPQASRAMPRAMLPCLQRVGGRHAAPLPFQQRKGRRAVSLRRRGRLLGWSHRAHRCLDSVPMTWRRAIEVESRDGPENKKWGTGSRRATLDGDALLGSAAGCCSLNLLCTPSSRLQRSRLDPLSPSCQQQRRKGPTRRPSSAPG